MHENAVWPASGPQNCITPGSDDTAWTRSGLNLIVTMPKAKRKAEGELCEILWDVRISNSVSHFYSPIHAIFTVIAVFKEELGSEGNIF